MSCSSTNTEGRTEERAAFNMPTAGLQTHLKKCKSLVDTENRLWAGWFGVRLPLEINILGQKRPDRLCSPHPRIQWVPDLVLRSQIGSGDQTWPLTSGSKVKNEWTYMSAPLYTLLKCKEANLHLRCYNPKSSRIMKLKDAILCALDEMQHGPPNWGSNFHVNGRRKKKRDAFNGQLDNLLSHQTAKRPAINTSHICLYRTAGRPFMTGNIRAFTRT
jgi:hypothetical protein